MSPGSARTHLGTIQRSPRPPAAFDGLTSKKGMGGVEERGREMLRIPYEKFLATPLDRDTQLGQCTVSGAPKFSTPINISIRRAVYTVVLSSQFLPSVVKLLIHA